WVHQQVSRKALTGGVQAVGLSPPMSCRNPKLVPTVWRVCRSHPQGREAKRASCPSTGQVRIGDQPQDRPSPWPRSAGNAARPRRRGDRVKRRNFITLLGGATV